MKINGLYYSVAISLLCLLNNKTLHAEISGEALVDLTICYGVDYPAEKYQAVINKDSRIQMMEETLASIRTMDSVKLSEVDGFYTPLVDIEVMGNPLQFIGLYGYGPLRGVNMVLGGSFDVVKNALENQKNIEYTRCDAETKYQLKVCHQDVSKRYSHMIMTHPNNTKHQVILICVDKKS
ncbi:MAG: hypothetical protein KME56_13885 [Candidatus Thiodiazotropha sp. (ex Ctena orbiculata)]|nr:hypothetical protein [Candidatus Thiodiazotropha taylori]MBT2997696.1 hypothetical protein [Candidatus Thiodiazotropha taylori]MBT3001883.1 hypothetical protein [Candidatus Thiodiazotropha taylori]MBT3026356.1 hypothetical protein [Candidatus Thiodiazotropha taylori]MBT3035713.1 hypothetical protein [Candidatus Thiodiazotropha taylori]